MISGAEKLIVPFRSAVYTRALQLCRDADHAEDLTQDTMLHGLLNFSQLRNTSKSKYWLFAILLNLYRKDYSKNKKFIKVNYMDFDNHLTDGSCLERECLQDEVSSKVRSQVEGLEVHLRTPLQLFYFRQFSYKQISRELKIPIGTVMSRIYRGRRSLLIDFTLIRFGYSESIVSTDKNATNLKETL